MFPQIYNIRYLGLFTKNHPGEIYKHSFESQYKYSNFFFNEESRMNELFELADKSDLFSSSMLQIDISELSSVDNYKESYPFTVIILKLFTYFLIHISLFLLLFLYYIDCLR
jgi:hypothetical protein